MRMLANLVIAVGLAAGVMGAVTAYLPRLDENVLGLTLNAAAGRVELEGGAAPIATPGEVITPELLQRLREEGVERVRVKEFAVGRWGGVWLFGAGCLGLLAGGVTLRRGAMRRAAGAGVEEVSDVAGPERSLEEIREAVEGLRRELGGIESVEERLRRIVEVLGEVQRSGMAGFVGAREALVMRLGLGEYARLMDRFAAAERQINRAWSAAVDGVEAEAMDCVERAAALLAETAETLREQGEQRGWGEAEIGR